MEEEIQKEKETKKEKKYYDFISVAGRTSQEVYFIAQHDKNKAFELLIKDANVKQRVVVCKSKKNADSLCLYLKEQGIASTAIHGNHRVEQVEKAKHSFGVSETNILITTDMILKSLDLKNIEVMISYDLPIDAQDYFYRLRQVDEKGKSISFVSSEDEKNFEAIEFTMRTQMKEVELEGFEATPAPRQEKKNKKPRHSKRKARKEIEEGE